jgi:hypothetical protein
MPKEFKDSTMWPELHEAVSSEIEEYNLYYAFEHKNRDARCIDDWDTNIMGRFGCPNEACRSTGWSSKKIATTIRHYPNNRYNAKVWYQRCKRCDTKGVITLNVESYVERVVYWLKRWNDIPTEKHDHSGASKGPHLRKYCEGCKAGRCAAADAEDLANLMSSLKWD